MSQTTNSWAMSSEVTPLLDGGNAKQQPYPVLPTCSHPEAENPTALPNASCARTNPPFRAKSQPMATMITVTDAVLGADNADERPCKLGTAAGRSTGNMRTEMIRAVVPASTLAGKLFRVFGFPRSGSNSTQIEDHVAGGFDTKASYGSGSEAIENTEAAKNVSDAIDNFPDRSEPLDKCSTTHPKQMAELDSRRAMSNENGRRPQKCKAGFLVDGVEFNIWLKQQHEKDRKWKEKIAQYKKSQDEFYARLAELDRIHEQRLREIEEARNRVGEGRASLDTNPQDGC